MATPAPNAGENHVATLTSASVTLVSLSLAGLMSRLVSRRMKRTPLRADDYLLIVACALCVAEAGLAIWASLRTTLGRHTATSSVEQIANLEKFLFVAKLLHPSLLALAKVSVLLLLRSIFVTRPFRITTTILMAVVVGWWAGVFFAGIFNCWPISSRWDVSVKGFCTDDYIVNIVSPLPWIITDVAILIAPLPMVRKLHLPIRRKVALTGLFLIGGLTCLVSIVRYRYGFFKPNDATVGIVPLVIWGEVESNVSVLCASLFASKPAAMAMWPERFITFMGLYFDRRRWGQHSKQPNTSRTPRVQDVSESQAQLPLYHQSMDEKLMPTESLHSQSIEGSAVDDISHGAEIV